MAYDGRVLRQATLRFDEDKQRRQEQALNLLIVF